MVDYYKLFIVIYPIHNSISIDFKNIFIFLLIFIIINFKNQFLMNHNKI
jgi:hypothetical protein